MDIICFSHLRWNFVYQRPHHILSRFAKNQRVFYIEEPVFGAEEDRYESYLNTDNVYVITPHLRENSGDIISIQKDILIDVFFDFTISVYVFWYYNPMAYLFSKFFFPELIVYDCMDELSAFKFAPANLVAVENELLKAANLVFTGGVSIYEAKKNLHENIYAFPSSIDKEHFFQARGTLSEPSDQKEIPHPRLGFFGVIDERLDIRLLEEMSQKKESWHFIIIGPIVKIDPNSLPKNANLHYLGNKTYHDLPMYISSWDIALIPFAINESTRFISPTKTPEYLAAGKPVISSPIRDVVNFYGQNKLVHIAENADEFIDAADTEFKRKDKASWQKYVDTFLDMNSWDTTWSQMNDLLYESIRKISKTVNKKEDYV